MSLYRSMNPDELEKLFSNYLVDSWSYSKLSAFSRHEKEFEMVYIYGHKSKKSSSTIAGQAYHKALQFYFEKKKEGEIVSLVELESICFSYIDSLKPSIWKVQKTTPTIIDCIEKADKTSIQLLRNFYSEKSVYEDDLLNIIEVEVYCDEFIAINGVEIPLPCHAVIDLVIETTENKIVIIDHKSKASFSNQEELTLSIGKQSITYVNCYEEKSGIKVNEVWFVENKYSQNRDKSKQLNVFKTELNEDNRKLYESLLYEPLKRMISAVSDPDYVYLINESDSYVDMAEIHEFWAKTMIAEVEDFNVKESKKELISRRLKKIRDVSIATISPKIIKQFKQNASEFIQYDLSNKDMSDKEKIEHVLRTFGIVVNVAHVIDGYSSNTYLLEVSAGVKIQSIHSHKLDIANVLDVTSIRIMSNLKVYEGKSYVSFECSKKRDKNLIFDPTKLEGKKIPIGIDNYNQTVVWDLENHSTPHMLICGATGSGKSVSILSTIEYLKISGVKNIIVLDPKYEFTNLIGCNVFNEIESIEKELENQVVRMNELVKTGKKEMTAIIFDEFADAVSSSKNGKELDVFEMIQEQTTRGVRTKRVFSHRIKSLEENLKILLQKGRSSGFRIISATQRASVKVITGDAKVNFPVVICFRVPKDVDSKVVLDESGAESLAGMGDGLIKSPEYPDIVRFQAFYHS